MIAGGWALFRCLRDVEYRTAIVVAAAIGRQITRVLELSQYDQLVGRVI